MIAMHINKLYQLYDKVAGSVIGPIMSHKREQPAIRIFHSWLQNKETGPGQHPHDFELLELGNQNEETGDISAERRVVATGSAWVESQEAREGRDERVLASIVRNDSTN